LDLGTGIFGIEDATQRVATANDEVSMPDHVANEVLLHNVNSSQCRQFVQDDKGLLSFEVLLPLPLYLWRGDFGAAERDAFTGSSMDAALAFWGTMRDAYGDVKVDDTAEGTLLRFLTAWDPRVDGYAHYSTR
jgi:hypothetical protein